MTRYGQQFGPDFTFLGVPMCDLDDPLTYADAQPNCPTAATHGRCNILPSDPDWTPWLDRDRDGIACEC